MFDKYCFEFLIDLELLEFASFWDCSAKSIFESTRSRDEVYSGLHDIYVFKSDGPEVVLFP